MKFLNFMLTLTLAVAGSAMADDVRYGSECGLTDLNGDESWVDIEERKTITLWEETTDEQIHALPLLAKQQLIIGANQLQDHRFGSTVEAVRSLMAASSGAEVHVSSFKVNGRKFTIVNHYPGDNPYGAIFKFGTRKLVAVTSDSDVICL